MDSLGFGLCRTVACSERSSLVIDPTSSVFQVVHFLSRKRLCSPELSHFLYDS